jgi:phosphatidylserine decarboxylase
MHSSTSSIFLLRNERFGFQAFVEVGAMSVGRIVQIRQINEPFRRGREIRLQIGGSAVVVFGEAGKWQPTDDILEHTERNRETVVRLGDAIATTSDNRART